MQLAARFELQEDDDVGEDDAAERGTRRKAEVEGVEQPHGGAAGEAVDQEAGLGLILQDRNVRTLMSNRQIDRRRHRFPLGSFCQSRRRFSPGAAP